MSAVEKYRAMCSASIEFATLDDARYAEESESLGLAAIAELETENEGLRSRRLPCAEAEVAQKRYEDAEAEVAKRDEILPFSTDIHAHVEAEPPAPMGDFPCTYCRGMDHHDPTCQLLVLRRIPEPKGGE